MMYFMYFIGVKCCILRIPCLMKASFMFLSGSLTYALWRICKKEMRSILFLVFSFAQKRSYVFCVEHTVFLSFYFTRYCTVRGLKSQLLPLTLVLA